MKLLNAILAASAMGADVTVEDSATIAYPNAEGTTSWTVTAANNGYLSMQFNEDQTKLDFFVSKEKHLKFLPLFIILKHFRVVRVDF